MHELLAETMATTLEVSSNVGALNGESGDRGKIQGNILVLLSNCNLVSDITTEMVGLPLLSLCWGHWGDNQGLRDPDMVCSCMHDPPKE